MIPGVGSYGIVKKATNIKTGAQYAVKILTVSTLQEGDASCESKEKVSDISRVTYFRDKHEKMSEFFSSPMYCLPSLSSFDSCRTSRSVVPASCTTADDKKI